MWSNANGGFTTGINIFDKEEQGKLQERAKRFALKPEEINNFTDQQLQHLHDSLGINAENEKEVRFEAIHMRGTDEMSTGDVLDYFAKYGPSGIEWVDDASCNVVWLDKISAARALHFVSKPIKNLPVRGPCDPFIKEFEGEEQTEESSGNPGRSVLLCNANREVELQEEGETQDDAEDKENALMDAVDLSEISCPIPPGFWRLGVAHAKAKYVLLRFAYKTDKKPYKAEKFSEYYKKYGNPNYGGLRGIISESHKLKFKGIFDRNREIGQKKHVDLTENESKNPWGGLAENWDGDAQFREREPIMPDVIPKVEKPELTSNLRARLGFKRARESQKEVDEEEEEVNEVVQKKVKIPRMRMYADEEEQKIKRKRQLMALKQKTAEPSNLGNTDLRNVLAAVSVHKNPVPLIIDEHEDMPDLGTKLKNRTWKANPERIQIVRHNELAERGAVREKNKLETRSRRFRSRSPSHGFERNLHSDRHERQTRHTEEHEYDQGHKPRSKVAVVIKTQKRPTVASAVWSRKEYDRLKTVSEGKINVLVLILSTADLTKTCLSGSATYLSEFSAVWH